MRKKLTLTTLLIATSMNQESFGMDQKNSGYLGWLTTSTNNDYQKLQPICNLTPIEKYCKLAIETTKALQKSEKYAEMADLIEIVYDAKNKNNIKAYDLGKFIFNQSPKSQNHAIASLVVARIGKYHQTMEDLHIAYMTKANLYLYTENKNEPKKSTCQAKQVLRNLNLLYNYMATPEEQNHILALDLSTIMMEAFDNYTMAKILYKDDNFIDNQEPETK